MYVDPAPTEAFGGRRARRTHPVEFKAKVVAACRVPGVSVAAVALAHGVNANLVRRWMVEVPKRPDGKAMVLANKSIPSFVPVKMPAAAPPPDIRIELRRGPIAINVVWPGAAASEFAAWMRELLR